MNEKHIQKKVHENRCLAKGTVTEFIHETCKIEALGGFVVKSSSLVSVDESEVLIHVT